MLVVFWVIHKLDIPYGLDSSPGAHQLLDMPLGTKLPANQCSSAMFYTTNLCEKIICTLKDFNEYRQYLTTIKLDFEKNYMREQRNLVKQLLELQEQDQLPEGIRTSELREWLLEEGCKHLRDMERIGRNRSVSVLCGFWCLCDLELKDCLCRHANKEIAVEKRKEASAVKICASGIVTSSCTSIGGVTVNKISLTRQLSDFLLAGQDIPATSLKDIQEIESGLSIYTKETVCAILQTIKNELVAITAKGENLKLSVENLLAVDYVAALLDMLKTANCTDVVSKMQITPMGKEGELSKIISESLSGEHSSLKTDVFRKYFEQLSSDNKIAATEDILGISKSQIIRITEDSISEIIGRVANEFKFPGSFLSTISKSSCKFPKKTSLLSVAEPLTIPCNNISSSSLIHMPGVNGMALDIVDTVLDKLLCSICSEDVLVNKELELNSKLLAQKIPSWLSSVKIKSGEVSISQTSAITVQLVNTVLSKFKTFVTYMKDSLSDVRVFSEGKSDEKLDMVMQPEQQESFKTSIIEPQFVSTLASHLQMFNKDPKPPRLLTADKLSKYSQKVQERQSEENIYVKNVVSAVLQAIKNEIDIKRTSLGVQATPFQEICLASNIVDSVIERIEAAKVTDISTAVVEKPRIFEVVVDKKPSVQPAVFKMSTEHTPSKIQHFLPVNVPGMVMYSYTDQAEQKRKVFSGGISCNSVPQDATIKEPDENQDNLLNESFAKNRRSSRSRVQKKLSAQKELGMLEQELAFESREFIPKGTLLEKLFIKKEKDVLAPIATGVILKTESAVSTSNTVASTIVDIVLGKFGLIEKEKQKEVCSAVKNIKPITVGTQETQYSLDLQGKSVDLSTSQMAVIRPPEVVSRKQSLLYKWKRKLSKKKLMFGEKSLPFTLPTDSSLANTKIGEEAGNILLQLSEKIYLDRSASLGKSFEQVFFECKTRAAEEILGISKSQIIKTVEQIVYDIIDDVESKVNRPAPIFSTTLELSSTVASLPQGTEPQLKPSIKIASGSLMSKTQVSLLASDIVDAVFENLLCAIGYDDIFAAKEMGVSGTEIHVPISTVESGAPILPSRISYVTEDIIKTVSGKLNPLMAQSKGYLSKLSLKDVHQRKSKLTSYTKEAASAILQAIKMELDRESLQKTALVEKVKISQLSFLASDFLAAVLENFKTESFAAIGSKTKITALQKEKDEQIVSWGDSLLAKWVCQKKAPKSRIFTSSSPADTETGPEAGNISLQLSEKIYLDRSDVNLVTTQIVGSVLEQLKKMKNTVVDFVPTMAEIYLLSKYLVTTIAEGMLSWLDILAKLEACTKAKNRKNENPEDKKKTSPRINKELARTNSKSSIEEGEKQNVKVSRSVSFDFYSGDIYYYSKAKRLTKGGILGMPYGKSVKEPSSSEEASRTTSECSKTPVVEEPVKVQFPYNLTLMSGLTCKRDSSDFLGANASALEKEIGPEQFPVNEHYFGLVNCCFESIADQGHSTPGLFFFNLESSIIFNFLPIWSAQLLLFFSFTSAIPHTAQGPEAQWASSDPTSQLASFYTKELESGCPQDQEWNGPSRTMIGHFMQ
ncbi:UNVERIFIED_CONTAM: hypothetical protein FKN15_026921 [Acipenser sinensis]